MESPRIKVKDVMSNLTGGTGLVKLTMNSTVDDAWKVIDSSNKKRIVVVGENNYPLKMLKVSDIAGHRRDQKISEMLDSLENVAIAPPDAEIDDIRSDLADGKLTVVLQDNKPVGVVTATDIARYWRKLT